MMADDDTKFTNIPATNLTDLRNGTVLERDFISSLFFDLTKVGALDVKLPDFSMKYFVDNQYANIYGAIRRRVNNGFTCNLADIVSDLEGKVSSTEISEAVNYFSGQKDSLQYARQIQELFFKRKLLQQVQEVIDDDGNTSFENIQSQLKNIVSEISKPAQINFNSSVLSLDELLKMDIPERYRLLPWLPEGGLIMVYGTRGIGKTYLTLELGKALACGSPFLKWEISKPTGVLFVDGEMPLCDIRSRFTNLLNEKPKASVDFLSHEHYYAKTEKDLNLASPDIQYSIQGYVESHSDIKVIIFDNLSCLLPGLREDKRDDWTVQVLPFLLWLRRRGIAVVLLHHSGKTGDQRGTSSREDALDTVIRLDRIPNSGNDGANFIIRFTKSRGAYGDDVSDIEAKLTMIGGVSTWTWKPLKESTEDRLLALTAEGIDSVKDMAEELQLSKGLV